MQAMEQIYTDGMTSTSCLEKWKSHAAWKELCSFRKHFLCLCLRRTASFLEVWYMYIVWKFGKNSYQNARSWAFRAILGAYGSFLHLEYPHGYRAPSGDDPQASCSFNITYSHLLKDPHSDRMSQSRRARICASAYQASESALFFFRTLQFMFDCFKTSF
jgi:hypothetical protein